MRAAGKRLGTDHFQARAFDNEFGIRDRCEFCFRHFAIWTVHVFITDSDERGFDGEFFFRHGAVGEQQIFFAGRAGW